MSRIIQGTKEIQDFYTRLRNEISSYPKLKSRVGWEHESIYTSRETIVLIKVKSDMLCVFLALDPSKFNKSKMEFGDVGKIKKYKNVPMLIKIQEEKDLENVIKLLEQICKKNKLLKEEIGNEDYHYEFRTDKELIEEGLIKEVKTYSGKLEQPEEEILTEDMIRSEINVTDAKEALTDEQALSLIETIDVEENKSAGTKKTIVNIGTLSRFYEPHEVVDLSSLKTKKIVSKDTGYVKILASGVLDKPLNVVANSYSIDAVKMILLTGGKVTKI
jgi:ribosomal protein L15/predicted transport protein